MRKTNEGAGEGKSMGAETPAKPKFDGSEKKHLVEGGRGGKKNNRKRFVTPLIGPLTVRDASRFCVKIH